jgi:AcrR family transcriptional regulator
MARHAAGVTNGRFFHHFESKKDSAVGADRHPALSYDS